MREKTYQLLCALNVEGIGCEVWGLAKDVQAKVFFGTNSDFFCWGRWLYIYKEKDDIWPVLDKIEPTMQFPLGKGSTLNLYKLD